jgi:hypothetical protein
MAVPDVTVVVLLLLWSIVNTIPTMLWSPVGFATPPVAMIW